MIVPRVVEVVIDSREKVPLLFPENIRWHPDRGGESKLVRVKCTTKALKTGDYLLSKWPACAIVERKGSLDELAQNLCSDDYSRFLSSIRRLSEGCRYPYLLIDASPTDLWRPTPRCPDPPRVWDHLCSVVHTFGVRLLWASHGKSAGPRRIVGEQIVRLLLAHALRGDTTHEHRTDRWP